MVARRCSMGCANWPDELEYAVCPCCKAITRRYRGITPLHDAEAESKRKHYEFEEFYARLWSPDDTSHTPSMC